MHLRWYLVYVFPVIFGALSIMFGDLSSEAQHKKHDSFSFLEHSSKTELIKDIKPQIMI
ncbi:unnamed protein product [Rhodiola kirilowii]